MHSAPLACAAAAALAAIVITVIPLTAHARPAARSAPRILPLAVAGLRAAVMAVAGEPTCAHPGAAEPPTHPARLRHPAASPAAAPTRPGCFGTGCPPRPAPP